MPGGVPAYSIAPGRRGDRGRRADTSGVVGQGDEPAAVTVEVVAVDGAADAGHRAGGGVLPEGVERCSGRKGAGAGGPARDPQRVVRSGAAPVAGAAGPPAGRGVDDRVAAGTRAVGVQESEIQVRMAAWLSP